MNLKKCDAICCDISKFEDFMRKMILIKNNGVAYVKEFDICQYRYKKILEMFAKQEVNEEI